MILNKHILLVCRLSSLVSRISDTSETLYHQNGRFHKKRNRRRNLDQDADSDERYENIS